MTKLRYADTLDRMLKIIRTRDKSQTMAAFIVDSPWLPDYIDADTLDFYFDSQIWLKSYLQLIDDLSGVAFVPGSWAEFGMATEPSGWGVKIQWSHSTPPSLHHLAELSEIVQADVPNPEQDGLMPLILRHYERMDPELKIHGIEPRIAAARGPLAVASHLIGVTELLMATQLEPDTCIQFLEKTTELIIRWLSAQLQRMSEPVGVLVLDDIVGMLGPGDVAKFAFPYLEKVFGNFPDMIHFYHNDTPNESIFKGLAETGVDVFNFSHITDIHTARRLLGNDIVLMGNIPPLDVLVRGTVNEVRKSTEDILEKMANAGPMLVSAGGGVSPGTPIRNLQTVTGVINTYTK